MMEKTGVKKAVVLLSGGLDSAVTLAYARREGYAAYALTFDYGQRHRVEIERARKVATALGASEHKVMAVDLRTFGGSALTSDMPVPDARAAIGAAGIPSTYVPARNTIFLSLGLAWAEVLQAEAIFIGANAVDYSGYPDCRPEYFEAYERLAALATRGGVQDHWRLRVAAPLLHLSKAQIVRLGKELKVDFSLTSSCYNPAPDGAPCGVCESCQLRKKGFGEAGEVDPAVQIKTGKEKTLVDSSVFISAFDKTSPKQDSASRFLEWLLKKQIVLTMPAHAWFEIWCTLRRLEQIDKTFSGRPIGGRQNYPIELIHIDEMFLNKYGNVEIKHIKAGDDIFLVIAKMNNYPLITFDKQMKKVAKDENIRVYEPEEFMNLQENFSV